MILVMHIGLSRSEIRRMSDREIQRWMVYYDEIKEIEEDEEEESLREMRRKMGALGGE